MGLSTNDRIAKSNAFNADVAAFIEANGPQTNRQLCEYTGCEGKALRAKLARMIRAGIIHSRGADGKRGNHVTYHVGPVESDKSEAPQQVIVKHWTSGVVRRDYLVAALFGAARA